MRTLSNMMDGNCSSKRAMHSRSKLYLDSVRRKGAGKGSGVSLVEKL